MVTTRNFPPSYVKTAKEADKINCFVKDRSKRSKGRNLTKISQNVIKERAMPLTMQADHFGFLREPVKKWLDSLRDAKIRLLEDGFISFTIWRDNGNDEEIYLKDIRTMDILTGIRMQENILRRYCSAVKDHVGEIMQLEELKEINEEIREYFLDYNLILSADPKEISKKIAMIITAFRRSIKPSKRKVLAQAESTAALKDSLDRHNPAALAARTVAIENKIIERLNEIKNIIPLIIERRKVLKIGTLVFGNICRQAANHLTYIYSDRLLYGYKNQAELKKQLCSVINLLDQLFVNPYHSWAMQCKYHIKEAIRQIGNNPIVVHDEVKEARDCLDKLFKR